MQTNTPVSTKKEWNQKFAMSTVSTIPTVQKKIFKPSSTKPKIVNFSLKHFSSKAMVNSAMKNTLQTPKNSHLTRILDLQYPIILKQSYFSSITNNFQCNLFSQLVKIKRVTSCSFNKETQKFTYYVEERWPIKNQEKKWCRSDKLKRYLKQQNNPQADYLHKLIDKYIYYVANIQKEVEIHNFLKQSGSSLSLDFLALKFNSDTKK